MGSGGQQPRRVRTLGFIELRPVERRHRNIPTEELRDFVAEDENARVAQDHALPARPLARPAAGLEGQGRAGRADLAVPVVPIYIQEKIHPQAIIDDLRAPEGARASRRGGRAYQLDLFADFNGGRRLRRARRVLPPRAELGQPHDPGRLAAGDDLSLAEKEGSRARSR
jgi:hypothetical protein